MADENKENRTEQASSRRIQEARDKGQVPQSLEFSRVLLLGAVMSFVLINVYSWGESFLRLGKESWGGEIVLQGNEVLFQKKINDAASEFLSLFYSLAALALIIPAIIAVAQRGWLFLPNRILPDFSRFRLKSWSEIFSLDSLYRFLSHFILFMAGVMLTISFFQKGENLLFDAVRLSPGEFIALLKKTLSTFSFKIFLVLLFLGIGDLFYRRWKFFRDLQMTPEEVRQENKDENGSSEMKTRQTEKIREIGRFQNNPKEHGAKGEPQK